MTREQLFQAMAGIDEERLEHSEKGQCKSRMWVRLGAAACIGLIAVTVGRLSPQILQNHQRSMAGISESQNIAAENIIAGGKSETIKSEAEAAKSGSEVSGSGAESAKSGSEVLGSGTGTAGSNSRTTGSSSGSVGSSGQEVSLEDVMETAEVKAEGFWLNGVRYTPIRYKDYKSFGFITESVIESATESVGQIRFPGQSVDQEKEKETEKQTESFFSNRSFYPVEADLGERMGVIEECEDEELVGCSVYHYISYPDSDRICIVKIKDSYQFYTVDEME